MYYVQGSRVALIFLLLLWLSVCYGTWLLKKSSDRYPIASISVEMTSEPLVAQTALDKVALWRNGYFLTQALPDIYQEIIQFPWVKSVHISRIWPDQVNIKIEPHQIRAIWKYGDRISAVTHEAVFVPIDKQLLIDRLPVLEGPKDSIAALWHFYETGQTLFNKTSYHIKTLRSVGESYWEIRLDNGIAIILGKEDADEQVVRLIRVLQQPLKNKVNQIAYIDLRYPTGFAVGWKQ
ncbi:MAG: Cell division protein FtsQ [Pseudomonadota bacterium]|jgi:cell division protein FtsQ